MTNHTAIAASAETVALALEFADETARSDIESECLSVTSGDRTWYDMSTASEGGRHWIDRADRYLRLRGDQTLGFKTIRNPAFPHLVRFEDGTRRCRRCGCTDARACLGGCHWVAVDLCSACEVAE